MKTRLLLSLMLALLFSFLSTSCTQAPEQNPIIQEKFQKLADLAEEVDQLKGKIKDIQNDIDTITQDLMTLKQMPKTTGVSPTQMEAMKSKIEKLEGDVSKSQSEMSKLKKETSLLKEVRSSRKAVEEKSPSSIKKPDPTPTPKKRGKYYTMKTGDTLESIARSFKTTADSIRKENHIPEGREPKPGTRIYIIPGD